jgi:hypothetical protein
MYSVRDILTGMAETSEVEALREVVRSVLCPQDSNVVVLNDEARKRALRKRLEGQQSRRQHYLFSTAS